MVEVVRYSAQHKQVWDAFVRCSKNGTFLFCRNYMEYHADRFEDHSLLFYRKSKLVALLPANETGKEIQSHGGLTYGGIISDRHMKAEVMLEVFKEMLYYFRSRGYQKMMYKAVPHIYHQVAAEEDLYALIKYGARICSRSLGSVIDLRQTLGYNYLRKRKLKQAAQTNLVLHQDEEFSQFMLLEQELLQMKYNSRPVHSTEEITKLAAGFPEHVKLYTATAGNELLAGVVIFETDSVARTQYIGTTAHGREVAALDLLLDWLLTKVYSQKRYFDFGTSMSQESCSGLNIGLVRNKESYGARTMVQDLYDLPL